MLRKAAKWAFKGDASSDSILASSSSAMSQSTHASPVLDGAWGTKKAKTSLIRGTEQDKAT